MLSNKPIVSVAMPIFCHSEKQLTTAIYSILNQTFKDLELIIVDGRLDDKNSKIISAIDDSRIRYFKTKGYVNCLNLGIEEARGKYIARMDSDDISYPTRIAEQVQFLDENPDISLCSCLVEYFGDEYSLPFSTHTVDIDLINMILMCEFVHTAMMFRKDINIHYDNIKPLEDCLLFRKLLIEGHKFEIIDKVLMKSYQSNGSIMRRHPDYVLYLISKVNVYALVKYYDLKLSFVDEIFTKRTFSKQEIIEFLEVVLSLKSKLKLYEMDILHLAFPYFSSIMSKTNRKCFLLKTKLFYQTFFSLYFKKFRKKYVEPIFSITNEYKDGIRTNENKTKVVRALGLKFKFKPQKA